MFTSLTRPKILLHVEGGVVLATSITLYARSGGNWGLFALLLLAPDLSMLGYLGGKAIGAGAYNFIHTYLPPAALAIYGTLAGYDLAIQMALIWFAHIGADRLLGYGLKYATDFKDTHLSRV
ncbi:MAG TPA: DUF4260 domain-containing protein [Anaerolineales bacterium]|nr:DUF4260 domain-containing protein [Anaerolineales bacterium]